MESQWRRRFRMGREGTRESLMNAVRDRGTMSTRDCWWWYSTGALDSITQRMHTRRQKGGRGEGVDTPVLIRPDREEERWASQRHRGEHSGRCLGRRANHLQAVLPHCHRCRRAVTTMRLRLRFRSQSAHSTEQRTLPTCQNVRSPHHAVVIVMPWRRRRNTTVRTRTTISILTMTW